jgi:hypothetical protein
VIVPAIEEAGAKAETALLNLGRKASMRMRSLVLVFAMNMSPPKICFNRDEWVSMPQETW